MRGENKREEGMRGGVREQEGGRDKGRGEGTRGRKG